MTHKKSASTADGSASLRRAIERQAKDAQGWAWDADSQCGVFRGQFNTVTIEAHTTGFVVDAWVGRTPSVHRVRDIAGQPFISGEYRTLGAALRNGRMYSNSNYRRA